MKRKIAAYNGKGEMFVLEEEMPPLKENEVLIRVAASLISPGTEMAGVLKLRKTPDEKKDFTRFGYANAGEIIELKGECRGLKKGMRVAAMGGGALHANYAAVPRNLVVPLADNVSFEEGAYACLGATALQAIRRTEPLLGEYGIILGLGIVGNLSAQLAQLSGARVMAWEGMNSRIEIARRCGLQQAVNFTKQDAVEAAKVFMSPYGADFAVFAFGGNGNAAMKNVSQCMKVSADGHKMGRVVLVGGCEITIQGGAGTGNMDIRSAARTGPGYHDSAYEYGNDYPSAFVPFTTQRNLSEIITLISEKRLTVAQMTTHRLPLESAPEAADLLINTPDRALGIIFQMVH